MSNSNKKTLTSNRASVKEFKKAIQKYGKPKNVYVDNGKELVVINPLKKDLHPCML